MPRRKLTRSEAKLATRAALIAAGLAEFHGDGLDVSLDAICERAGVTRGAFYVHFADRDAFIVAVMEQVLGGFVAALTALTSQPGGVARLIAMYFEAVRTRAPAVTGGSGLRMQHLMEACRRSPKVGAAYRGLVLEGRDRVAEGLAIDQRAGRVRDDVAAPALADLDVVLALGIASLHELEVPVDVAGVGRTLLALTTSTLTSTST